MNKESPQPSETPQYLNKRLITAVKYLPKQVKEKPGTEKTGNALIWLNLTPRNAEAAQRRFASRENGEYPLFIRMRFLDNLEKADTTVALQEYALSLFDHLYIVGLTYFFTETGLPETRTEKGMAILTDIDTPESGGIFDINKRKDIEIALYEIAQEESKDAQEQTDVPPIPDIAFSLQEGIKITGIVERWPKEFSEKYNGETLP